MMKFLLKRCCVVSAGIILFLLGFSLNAHFIGGVFDPDGSIDSFSHRALIYILQFILFSVGIYLVLTKKRVVLRAVLFILGILLLFFSVEVITRSFFPMPAMKTGWEDSGLVYSVCSHDATVGWRGRPMFSGELNFGREIYRVEHGPDGYRRSGTRKGSAGPVIVVTGDERAWGLGVDDVETFSFLIGRSGLDPVVYNIAQPGYGTDQSYLSFRKWVSPGRLDHVFYIFHEDDMYDNVSRRSLGVEKPRFIKRGDNIVLQGVPVSENTKWERYASGDMSAPGWTDIADHLLKRSHFYNRLRDMAAVPGYGAYRKPDPLSGEITRELLVLLDKEVERRGGVLTVIILPERGKVGKGPSRVSEIEAVCRDNDIAYLLPASGDAGSEGFYFRREPYMTPYGHRVVAGMIIRHIEDYPEQGEGP